MLGLGTCGCVLLGLCVTWHCSYDLVVCGVSHVICSVQLLSDKESLLHSRLQRSPQRKILMKRRRQHR